MARMVLIEETMLATHSSPRVLCACAIAALLSGCMAYVLPLDSGWRSSDFHKAALQEEGVAVGAFVDGSGAVGRGQGQALSATLAHAMAHRLGRGVVAHHPAVGIVPTEMPPSAQDDVAWSSMAHAIRPRRYAAFASLERNEIDKDRYEDEDERCFVTMRRLQVRLRIFDTATRRETWSGSVTSQPSGSRCNIKTQAKGKGVGGFFASLFVGALVEVAADVVKGTHPAPPPLLPETGTVLVHLAEHAVGEPTAAASAGNTGATWRYLGGKGARAKRTH